MNNDIIVSLVDYDKNKNVSTVKHKFDINGNIVDLSYTKDGVEGIRNLTKKIKHLLDTKLYCKIPALIDKYGMPNIFFIMDSVFNNEFKLYIRYCCKALSEEGYKVNRKYVWTIMIKGSLNCKLISMDPSHIHKRGYIFLQTIMDEIDRYKDDSYLDLAQILNNLDHKAFLKYQDTFTYKHVSEMIVSKFRDEFKVFIKSLAGDYTKNQEIITYNDLIYYLRSGHMNTCKKDSASLSNLKYDEILLKDIEEIVKAEYNHQLKVFLNKKVKKEEDIWRVFFLNIGAIRSCTFDFTKINKEPLKNEVKEYIYYHLYQTRDKERKTSIRLTHLCRGIKVLLDLNKNILFARDIRYSDVKKMSVYFENEVKKEKIAFGTYRMMISEFRLFIDFLINLEGYNYPPKDNHFRKTKFKNIAAMEQKGNTNYIPENIIRQIQEHISEVPEQVQRAWFIMMNTGMRVCEVLFLEDDKLGYDEKEETFILEYIPYKVLEARKNHGLPEYHKIPVNTTVAECFLEQKSYTEKLRFESGFKYIYTSSQGRSGAVSLYSSDAIIENINKLIETHNIVDENGDLYKYENRQCRKTVAVDLLTKGVSVEQVADILSQLHSKTTFTYYKDVEKKHLANMESEFYHELLYETCGCEDDEAKEIILEEINLGIREVEDGQCVKHISMGVCKRNSCAGCAFLITGPEKLKRWEELYKSKEKSIRELEEYYKEEEISDYKDYREYQSELNQLDLYKSIIKRIKEKIGGKNEH